jgi:hypothetical protein
MEKIISMNLVDFLLQSNVIPPNQHGFTPGRSTLTNLLDAVDNWTRSLDNGSPVDVVYLDLEKAFDRVPTQRLLLKLEQFGVRGQLLRWIGSFLTNRKFLVRVGNQLSDPRAVLSGVPQGSVLGPILFLIFTADLTNSLCSCSNMFADDTKLFTNPLINQELLQSDLNTVFEWSQHWLLTLNISKCHVLRLGYNNPKRDYFINENQVQSVSNEKDLGVTISEDMKWERHILSITGKAYSRIHCVRKAFLIPLDKSLFLKIYKIYIRPILEYASPVWDPYYAKDIQLIERVQKRATRLVIGLKNLTYEERLNELKLPTLRERRTYYDLIYLYKILHGYFSYPLDHFFQISPITHLRGHRLKLIKPKFTRLARQHFFSNRVINPWNSLPDQIIDSNTICSFKVKLFSHLFLD